MTSQAARDMSFILTWSPWGSRLLPSSFSLWKIFVPCGHRTEISVSMVAANSFLLLFPRLASPSYPPGNWCKTASLLLLSSTTVTIPEKICLKERKVLKKWLRLKFHSLETHIEPDKSSLNSACIQYVISSLIHLLKMCKRMPQYSKRETLFKPTWVNLILKI